MNKSTPRPWKNWHEKQKHERTFGDRLADSMASFVGSWTFVIVLTLFIAAWIGLNVIGFALHWDPFPFILLNLFFSAQATYSTPLIMMSQNRSAERDRANAEHDYWVNERAKEEIEYLMTSLERIESDKLDEILRLLKKRKK